MKLGLGTVQFGMDYGISNRDGRTMPGEVKRILSFAAEHGVEVIDTAPAYGDSESVVGAALEGIAHNFRIVTKTPVFGRESIIPSDGEALKKAFGESLKKLRRESLAGLLCHNADDLLKDGGEILFKEMASLREKGLAGKIGASVYDGRQIDALIASYDLDLIQLPVNVLDQRLIRGGQLERLRKKGVEVHARSVFLQGLLLMEAGELDEYFAPVRPVLQRYREFLDSKGLAPVEGAMAFVKLVAGVDYVITGVNHTEHLGTIVKSFDKTYDVSSRDFDGFAIDDPRYLNPSLWSPGS